LAAASEAFDAVGTKITAVAGHVSVTATGNSANTISPITADIDADANNPQSSVKANAGHVGVIATANSIVPLGHCVVEGDAFSPLAKNGPVPSAISATATAYDVSTVIYSAPRDRRVVVKLERRLVVAGGPRRVVKPASEARIKLIKSDDRVKRVAAENRTKIVKTGA
jgi:hypothetical protein